MADPSKRPIIIKKKKGGHGGHHGGAWKVAYADFVTAMMALFIVLWLLSSSEKVKKAVSGYFKDPFGKGKNVGTDMDGTGRDLNSAKDDMSALKEKLQSAIKLVPHFEQLKGNVEFTITEEGLRIDLIEDSKGIFFDSGNAEPSEACKEVLTALSKQIDKLPNRVLIEGHTDAAKYGSLFYTNWELSADRANAARRLMESTGLTPNQVVQVRGYADQDLRIKDKPEDPANRRVTVIIRYQDSPKEIKLNANNIQTSIEHPKINPASLPSPSAVAKKGHA